MGDQRAEGKPPAERLLAGPVVVVNLGLEGFFDELRAGGAAAIHVDWRPPAGGDPALAAILARLGA